MTSKARRVLESLFTAFMEDVRLMPEEYSAAAGAIEAIVCVLALRDQFFPPTINHETHDPACDLDCVPNQGVHGTLRAALSTSLGFGGHNGILAFRKVAS